MNNHIVQYNSNFIPLAVIAKEFGVKRSTVRYFALKNGFTFSRIRTAESRGKLTLCLSPADFKALKTLRWEQGYNLPNSK